MLFVVESYHPLAVKYTAYAKKSLLFIWLQKKKKKNRNCRRRRQPATKVTKQ